MKRAVAGPAEGTGNSESWVSHVRRRHISVNMSIVLVRAHTFSLPRVLATLESVMSWGYCYVNLSHPHFHLPPQVMRSNSTSSTNRESPGKTFSKSIIISNNNSPRNSQNNGTPDGREGSPRSGSVVIELNEQVSVPSYITHRQVKWNIHR